MTILKPGTVQSQQTRAIYKPQAKAIGLVKRFGTDIPLKARAYAEIGMKTKSELMDFDASLERAINAKKQGVFESFERTHLKLLDRLRFTFFSNLIHFFNGLNKKPLKEAIKKIS